MVFLQRVVGFEIEIRIQQGIRTDAVPRSLREHADAV